jgi:hypothetical protein
MKFEIFGESSPNVFVSNGKSHQRLTTDGKLSDSSQLSKLFLKKKFAPPPKKKKKIPQFFSTYIFPLDIPFGSESLDQIRKLSELMLLYSRLNGSL